MELITRILYTKKNTTQKRTKRTMHYDSLKYDLELYQTIQRQEHYTVSFCGKRYSIQVISVLICTDSKFYVILVSCSCLWYISFNMNLNCYR